MSINPDVPAKPEDESKKQHDSIASDVVDAGLDASDLVLSSRSSVPPVTAASTVSDMVASTGDAAQTVATAAVEAVAATVEAGASVGDVAEGVLDVIGGLFDAS